MNQSQVQLASVQVRPTCIYAWQLAHLAEKKSLTGLCVSLSCFRIAHEKLCCLADYVFVKRGIGRTDGQS